MMSGRLRPAAETAARIERLDLHLLRLQAENGGNRGVLDGLKLTAETRHRARAVPFQEAVERLHRRMREIGEDKFGFGDLAGALLCAGDVSLRGSDPAL